MMMFRLSCNVVQAIQTPRTTPIARAVLSRSVQKFDLIDSRLGRLRYQVILFTDALSLGPISSGGYCHCWMDEPASTSRYRVSFGGKSSSSGRRSDFPKRGCICSKASSSRRHLQELCVVTYSETRKRVSLN